MEKVMNVLIINAHQLYQGSSKGKLNKSMVDIAKIEFEAYGHQVQTTYIEQGYDAAEEVEKYLWADIIITQAPVYWFSTPWIHKKYMDELLNTGLIDNKLLINDGRTREDPSSQYGTGGNMHNKKFMLSLTWNAPSDAFEDETQYLYAGKSVDDAFIAITSAYKFCGAEIIPSFSCFDVMKAPVIERDIVRYKQHLSKYFI